MKNDETKTKSNLSEGVHKSRRLTTMLKEERSLLQGATGTSGGSIPPPQSYSESERMLKRKGAVVEVGGAVHGTRPHPLPHPSIKSKSCRTGARKAKEPDAANFKRSPHPQSSKPKLLLCPRCAKQFTDSCQQCGYTRRDIEAYFAGYNQAIRAVKSRLPEERHVED